MQIAANIIAVTFHTILLSAKAKRSRREKHNKSTLRLIKSHKSFIQFILKTLFSAFLCSISFFFLHFEWLAFHFLWLLYLFIRCCCPFLDVCGVYFCSNRWSSTFLYYICRWKDRKKTRQFNINARIQRAMCRVSCVRKTTLSIN